MHVGPHDRAIDAIGSVQQVVMVIPIDGDIDEAQDVAEKDRKHSCQSR